MLPKGYSRPLEVIFVTVHVYDKEVRLEVDTGALFSERRIHTPPDKLWKILDKQSTVFKDELGLTTEETAKMYIEELRSPYR